MWGECFFSISHELLGYLKFQAQDFYLCACADSCKLFYVLAESSYPINMALSICHAAYLIRDYTTIEIEPSFGYEASDLYPDVKYTTVEEFLEEHKARTPFYLNQFLPINN